MYSSTAKYAAALLPSMTELIVEYAADDGRSEHPQRRSLRTEAKCDRLSNERHDFILCARNRRNVVESRPITVGINN